MKLFVRTRMKRNREGGRKKERILKREEGGF